MENKKSTLIDKMDNKVLPYIGYGIGFFSGNPLTSLAGAGTKIAQDTNTMQKSKTADYIRMGALGLVTLDCVLGLPGTFGSFKEFWETSADVITAAALYSDLRAYSTMAAPVKETYQNAVSAVKNWYNSRKGGSNTTA